MDEALAIMSAAYDKGCNFFDNAEAYAAGQAEMQAARATTTLERQAERASTTEQRQAAQEERRTALTEAAQTRVSYNFV